MPSRAWSRVISTDRRTARFLRPSARWRTGRRPLTSRRSFLTNVAGVGTAFTIADWALVDDPKTRFKVGDKVNVKIIDIKDGRVFLSLKALKPDPWLSIDEKHAEGETSLLTQ